MEYELIDDTFTAQMWPVSLEHEEGKFQNGESEMNIKQQYSAGLASQTRTTVAVLAANLL